MSLIDSLLDNVKDVIAAAKKPLQKRLVNRGLEKALDSIEGIKGDAELKIIDLREKLVTAKSEDEVKAIFSQIVSARETVVNAIATEELLNAEKAELFGK